MGNRKAGGFEGVFDGVVDFRGVGGEDGDALGFNAAEFVDYRAHNGDGGGAGGLGEFGGQLLLVGGAAEGAGGGAAENNYIGAQGGNLPGALGKVFVQHQLLGGDGDAAFEEHSGGVEGGVAGREVVVEVRLHNGVGGGDDEADALGDAVVVGGGDAFAFGFHTAPILDPFRFDFDSRAGVGKEVFIQFRGVRVAGDAGVDGDFLAVHCFDFGKGEVAGDEFIPLLRGNAVRFEFGTEHIVAPRGGWIFRSRPAGSAYSLL